MWRRDSRVGDMLPGGSTRAHTSAVVLSGASPAHLSPAPRSLLLLAWPHLWWECLPVRNKQTVQIRALPAESQLSDIFQFALLPWKSLHLRLLLPWTRVLLSPVPPWLVSVRARGRLSRPVCTVSFSFTPNRPVSKSYQLGLQETRRSSLCSQPPRGPGTAISPPVCLPAGPPDASLLGP